MYNSFKKQLQKELSEIKKAGLYKEERVITTAQGTDIDTTKNKNVINFCANNYLGLANHHDLQSERSTVLYYYLLLLPSHY